MALQSVPEPDAGALRREVDERPQPEVNGFADRCCTLEYFFKKRLPTAVLVAWRAVFTIAPSCLVQVLRHYELEQAF